MRNYSHYKAMKQARTDAEAGVKNRHQYYVQTLGVIIVMFRF